MPALLCTLRTHNRLLCTTVYKGFDRCSVNLHGDIEHDNSSKALGRVLKRVFHVFKHSLLPNCLFNAPLSLDVVWICIETCSFEILFLLGLRLALRCLSQKLCKACRIVSRCGRKVWMYLG